MALDVVLEHPTAGMLGQLVVAGTLDFVLDRYPRWSLTASLKPDPDAVHLWQSPYGTVAHVLTKAGSLMFSGPLVGSQISRPSGLWQIQAADVSALLMRYRTSNRPGQFLPGTTMTLRAFIEALAAKANVPVTVVGDQGAVDVRGLDIAGSEAWSLIEEQLIGNNLDAWPQPDGSLLIAPTAAMKAEPEWMVGVGETGLVTGYTVSMERIYNAVWLTHEASKDGESETRYIDGAWTDSTSPTGTAIGVYPYVKTVRVGQDWWDDPAGHQAQADAAAASVAMTLRGFARTATVDMVPRHRILPGHTVMVTFMSGVSDKFLVVGAAWPLEVGEVARLELRNPDPDWPGSTFFKEAADARRNAQ